MLRQKLPGTAILLWTDQKVSWFWQWLLWVRISLNLKVHQRYKLYAKFYIEIVVNFQETFDGNTVAFGWAGHEVLGRQESWSEGHREEED